MTTEDVKNVLEIGGMIVVWIVTAAVGWTKLTGKIDNAVHDGERDRGLIREELLLKASKEELNGFGQRVTSVEGSCSGNGGRMDRFEKELSEYRRDAQDASRGLARVEKGVDDIHESINQGNLQLGSQLHAMEKAIQDKDVRTQLRLTRIETIAKIEEKIGPLPTDQ